MLESLTVKNFRSCEDVQVRLGEPVIALVGKNGVGKTNLLHALKFVVELCLGPSDPPLDLHPADASSPTELSLAFAIDDSHYVYMVRRSRPPRSVERFEETLTKDGSALFQRNGESLQAPDTGLPTGFRIGLNAASLPSLLQILPKAGRITPVLATVSEYLQAVRYYPLLREFQEHTLSKVDVIEAQQYATWTLRPATASPQLAAPMRLLHLWLTNDPRFREITALVGEGGLGLVEDIQIQDLGPSGLKKHEDAAQPKYYAIMYKPGAALAGAGVSFISSGLSSGTLRILELFTYLLYDKASCMLLEQPEDCIHPGLLTKVIDILRTYSDRSQVICTTHSPYVMNLVGAKGIRVVTADKGQTVVNELSAEELEAADHYLADKGTLAEFLQLL